MMKHCVCIFFIIRFITATYHEYTIDPLNLERRIEGNTSLVMNIQHPYTLEDIYLKAFKYEWNRQKRLLFFVLLKLTSIDINDHYDLFHHGDLSIFKADFNHNIEKFRNVLRGMYEENKWLNRLDENDPVIEKLLEMEKSISEYVAKSEIKSILTRKIRPLVHETIGDTYEKVLTFLSNISESQRNDIEIELLYGSGGEKFNLIHDTFKVGHHFEEVSRHRDLIFIGYSELSAYLPNLTMIELITHDWTKYLFEISLGYTWKWFHGNGGEIESENMLRAWRGITKDKEDYNNVLNLWDLIWTKAAKFHCSTEDYCPEFFSNKSRAFYLDNRRLKEGNNMNDFSREEAFIDMVSRNLSVLIDTDHKFDALKDAKYVEFELKRLDKFNYNDVNKIVEKILRILKVHTHTAIFIGKKRKFDEYLEKRSLIKETRVSH